MPVMILSGLQANPLYAGGFRPPVSSGLLGWWWLGGDQASTEKDHAYIGNGTLAGSVTLHDGYASFAGYSAGQWLQTEVAETNDLTLMCVARTSDTLASAAYRPMMMGWFGGDPGYASQGNGSCLYYGSTSGLPQGFLRGTVGHVTAGTVSLDDTAPQTVPDVTAWRFLAVSFDDTSNVKLVSDLTAAASATNTISTARSPHTVNRLRIGGGFNASFSGACDVAWAAVYNRALTAEEKADTRAFVNTVLSDRHGFSS